MKQTIKATQPKISPINPVYNDPPNHLEEATKKEVIITIGHFLKANHEKMPTSSAVKNK